MLRPCNFFPSSGCISKTQNLEHWLSDLQTSMVVLQSQPNSEKILKVVKEWLDKVVSSEWVEFDIDNLQGKSN